MLDAAGWKIGSDGSYFAADKENWIKDIYYGLPP